MMEFAEGQSGQQTGRDACWNTVALRGAMILGLVGVCLFLAYDRLSDIRVTDVVAAMEAIPLATVALAFALGILSHVALAGYDLLAMARIGRQVPWPRALKGGFAGTVMSQVVGFGLITGSFARSRIYRANGIDVPQAVALSGFVAAGFFSGLSVLMMGLTLLDPAPVVDVTGLGTATCRALAAAGLSGVVVFSVLAMRHSAKLCFGSLTLRAPDGRWLAGATVLALADLLPAALCLAVLLPEQGMPSIAAFVGIYIVAVALGHMIGSPGAAGPFEGVLFLALPMLPASDLAAGILIYRLVYYLPAFVVALGCIALARRCADTDLLSGDALRNRIDWIADMTPNAEVELAYLGDKHIYCTADSTAFLQYGVSGRVWLVMGDPIGPKRGWSALADSFEAEARAEGATIAIYKATESSRLFWQGRGWFLLALGQEGSVDAADWTLDTPDRRELRRKCRKVDKAGITITHHFPMEQPLSEMSRIAEAWCDAKDDREQSFSMGHWSRAFVARHVAICAWQEDRLIAFLTLWQSGDGSEWMLDLMRQLPDVPNGTMHRLLAEAISMAQEHGARRFNLCMAPLSGLKDCKPVTLFSHLGNHIYVTRDQDHGLQGIRRFKEIFRPEWETRYLAVRSVTAMPEALLAATRLVHRQSNPIDATERHPVLALATLSDLDATDWVTDADGSVGAGEQTFAATG